MGSKTVTHRWSAVVDEGHFDVVTARELETLGIPRSQVKSWVRTGRLFPLHAGVWAVGRPQPRLEGRWRAAVLGCPPRAVLSHHSAARAHDLAAPVAAAVHVTTTSRARSGAGRVVHRATEFQPQDLTVRHGIPCTALERTLVDLADVVTYPELRLVFDRLRRLDLPRLAAARARAGKRHGAQRLTHLVERDEPHTRSEFERRFLRFVDRAGIRRPDAINARRHGYELDCAYDTERVVVELDGRAFHRRADQMRADRHRDAELHLRNWVPHRLVWEDLNPYSEDASAATLRALLAARRPR